MTVFKMWEQHYLNNTLPKEWPIWEDFRAWVIENKYKAEYGYKGEFSPAGCLKSMPGHKETEVTEKGESGESTKKKTNSRNRNRV